VPSSSAEMEIPHGRDFSSPFFCKISIRPV
jgi:hypothetical protein